MLDLTSDGELTKEVLKGTHYGCQPFEKTINFEEELGDIFFALICLANESNVLLEDGVNQVLTQYQ